MEKKTRVLQRRIRKWELGFMKRIDLSFAPLALWALHPIHHELHTSILRTQGSSNLN